MVSSRLASVVIHMISWDRFLLPGWLAINPGILHSPLASVFQITSTLICFVFSWCMYVHMHVREDVYTQMTLQVQRSGCT